MSPQEHGQELQAQENQETKRLLLQMMARMDTLTQEVIQLKEEKEELLKCLLDQLRLSFGDPHVQEKAQRKLHKLRQTNKPFMEYFTEFRKLVLEAGGTN
ncbi:hypothetical protein GTA08_BOTSDO05782 [Botryosphaeria dothidea]|uniref:Retrotransposon gag domain-containing protein n=1 Tax=Botryosphaeria dothidea TaxID=55169 RepID=A0A8H4IRX6_9PEZI|nr:hypothetical protein GTA08_BOTSDO05782 [Botryosphaeria dothidea]